MLLGLLQTPACPPRIHLAVKQRESWQCFFPQFSLNHIAYPTVIVNSATDFSALRVAFQPPSDVAFTSCVEYVTSSRSQSHEAPPDGCSPTYQRGVRMYSSHLRGNVTTLERVRRSISSVILPQSRHCVAIYPNWTTIAIGGRRLPSAISDWYNAGWKHSRLQDA